MAFVRQSRFAHVGILLLLFLALKVFYVVEFASSLPFIHAPIADSAYYDDFAREVISHKTSSNLPYYLAPGYPYFLALLYLVFGTSPWVVIISQLFLGVVTLFCIYLLGTRLHSHKAGLFAFALAGLYAPFSFVETKLLSETLAIALFMGSLVFFTQKKKTSSLLVSAFLLGLATVCRPVFGLAFLLFFLHFLVKKKFRHSLVSAVCFLLPILPVTVRNIVVSGEFVPITTNAGIVFAQGNNPDAHGIATPLPGFSLTIQDQQKEEMAIASKALGKKVTATEAQSYSFWTTVHKMLEAPGTYLFLLFEKIVFALHVREARDVYSLDLEQKFVTALSSFLAPFPLIFGFALIGLFWHRPRGWAFFFLPLISCFLPLIIFSVSFRYRLPFAAMLCVWGGAGGALVVQWLSKRQWKKILLGSFMILLSFVPSLMPYPVPEVGPEALNNLGFAYFKTGDEERARKATMKALEIAPDFAPAIYNLAIFHLRKNQADEAMHLLQRFVMLRPLDAKAWHNLGVCFDQLGKKEEAVLAYKKTLSLDDSSGQTHYNLALALFDLGAYQEALFHLQEAKRLGIQVDPMFEKALIEKSGDS